MTTRRRTLRGGPRALLLALASLSGLLAACESTTGPGDEPAFDAQAALADYTALDSVLGSAAMAELRALAAGGPLQGVAGPEAAALEALRTLGRSPRPREARAFALGLAEAFAQSPVRPQANPIISAFRRGKTFVYDPAVGHYVADESREGAPPTGVRFVLYRPGADGKPDPSAEVGYADLIDEGDESAEEVALRLVVVHEGVTVLEYRTTVDVMAHGGRITVDGFLQGEYDRLDFDIQVQGTNGSEGATIDLAFEMGIASRDFQITGSLTGVNSESGEGGEVHLTVRHGDDSFQVAATGTESSLEGTVHLNGKLFATVSGDPDAPTFTGASGQPLTWVEMLVLHRILDATEDVFDLFEDLLDPVDELVLIAIIL